MAKLVNIFAVILLIVGLIVGAGIGMTAFPKTITQTETKTEIITNQVTIFRTETTTVELTQRILSENEYKLWAARFALDIAEFSDATMVTSNAVSKNCMSLLDEAEIFDAMEALTRRMLDEAKSIIPPEKYKDAHHHLTKAIDYYHQAFAYAAEGARKIKPDMIKKATELIKLANAELIKAEETLPEIKE